MIRGENDDRILSQACFLELVEQPANFLVDIGNHREIGMARLLEVVLRQTVPVPAMGEEQGL